MMEDQSRSLHQLSTRRAGNRAAIGNCINDDDDDDDDANDEAHMEPFQSSADHGVCNILELTNYIKRSKDMRKAQWIGLAVLDRPGGPWLGLLQPCLQN